MAHSRNSRLKAERRNAPGPGKSRRATDISTEDLIVDTAAGLFARFGYDAVSTKQLAAEAGVTIGALYHYFSGKEELYERVISSTFSSKSLVPRELLDSQAPAQEKLTGMVSLFIDSIITDSNFGMLLQRELLNPDSQLPDKLITRHFNRAYSEFRTLIAELMPGSNLDLAFASLLALCLGFANLKGIYKMVPEINRVLNTPEQIAGHVTTLLLKGMS